MQLDAQKLIDEIHRGAHDAGAMGTDRVGDVPDADGVEVLVVAAVLHECLRVQIVQVSATNAESVINF